MARIDWAVLCQRAYFDEHERLCMHGVPSNFPVPALPVFVRRIMVVVRLAEVERGETLQVGCAISAGSAHWEPATDGFDVEQAGEYLLITLHDVPFVEPVPHRFMVSVDDHHVVVEVPVNVVKPAKAATPLHSLN